ncbi:MAG: NADH-quinone oxidoreductase subunit NuoN [Planctomycetota bacterium]
MGDKLVLLVPELILLTGAVVLAVMGLSPRQRLREMLPAVTCAFLAAAFIATPLVYRAETVERAGLLMPELGKFVKMAVAFIGVILAMLGVGLVDRRLEQDVQASRLPFDPLRVSRGEFFAFFLLSLTGVMLCCNAVDLIWLFLALELTSLPTYIMVAMSRSSRRAQEASVKYFFLGAMAAAVFLYGFALLYGATGTIVLAEMKERFAEQRMLTGTINPIGTVGMILAILGVSFKIAAVPMHFYAADVYEGAAAPVTAFLGFVPKVAGTLALILLLGTLGWGGWGATGGPGDGWALLPPPILATLLMMAGLTMTLGNIGALLQKSVKRMLAYSSIAHSGYLLIGIIAGPGLGIAAVLFYLLAYGLMNTGAFAVLAGLERQGEEIESVDDLAGLRQRHPVMAWSMAICAGSLLGFPPLLGFIGKLMLLVAGVQAEQIVIVVVAVINSAISAWYYLRLVGLPILAKPSARGETIVPSPATWRRVAAVICALAQLVLILPYFTGLLLHAAGHRTAAAAVAPAEPVRTDVAEAPGALAVELRDTQDPVRLGEIETYVIEIRNQGDRPDTNVRVTCTIEPTARFTSASGPTTGRYRSGVVTFDPLEWLAADETATFYVSVEAVAPADSRFHVQVHSEFLGERPVEESEATTLYE